MDNCDTKREPQLDNLPRPSYVFDILFWIEEEATAHNPATSLSPQHSSKTVGNMISQEGFTLYGEAWFTQYLDGRSLFVVLFGT